MSPESRESRELNIVPKLNIIPDKDNDPYLCDNDPNMKDQINDPYLQDNESSDQNNDQNMKDKVPNKKDKVPNMKDKAPNIKSKFTNNLAFKFPVVKRPKFFIGKPSLARRWPRELKRFHHVMHVNYKIFGSKEIKFTTSNQSNKVKQDYSTVNSVSVFQTNPKAKPLEQLAPKVSRGNIKTHF